jgi:hypothetical protein
MLVVCPVFGAISLFLKQYSSKKYKLSPRRTGRHPRAGISSCRRSGALSPVSCMAWWFGNQNSLQGASCPDATPRLTNHDRIAIYSAVHRRDLGSGSKELLGSFMSPPLYCWASKQQGDACLSDFHCPITMASCVHAVSVTERPVRECMLFVYFMLGIVVSFLTSVWSYYCLSTFTVKAAGSIAASWFDGI